MAIQYHSALDRTFHALGDGTRREMLAMLARMGMCSAGELGRPFNISQPTASKHLLVLERAGLVRRQIQGREHRFQLEAAALQEAQDWIGRHSAFWEGTLSRLEQVVEADEEEAGEQIDTRDRGRHS